MINLNSVSKASSILLESLSEQNQEKYSDFVHDLSSQIKKISRAYKTSGLSLEDVLAALEEIALHYEYLEDIDDLLESFKGRKNQINQLNSKPLTEAVLDGLKEYEQKGWDWWGIPGVKVKSHRGYPSLEYKGFLFNISDTEDALKDSFIEETGLDPDEEKNEKKFDKWIDRHGKAWFDAAASEEEEALDDFDDDDKLESFRNEKLSNTLIIESICDLLEASMSDEDKRDSEIIRNLYKRVGGKKVSKFTPEEQEVIDKYGLDVWGFRGDTAMITPGKNDVVKQGDLGKTSWNGKRFIPNENADKINFADRIRKTDSREWGRKYSNVNDAYKQEYERADQAREMQRPYNELKSAKSRYNYSKSKVDDYYNDLAKQIEKADTEYTKAADTAYQTKRFDNAYNSSMINDAQDTVDRILNKHKKAVKEALKQLSLKEAMSDEDRKDSQLLRNILSKIEKRANAKLTPEEQAVLDKYDIERTHSGSYNGLRSHNNPDIAMTLSSGSDTRRINNPEYNLAGKFRAGDRRYARNVKTYSYGKDTFQAAERAREDTAMGHDVTMMKNALDARRRGQAGKERAELEYNDAMDAAKANRERKIAQLIDLERYKGYRDQAEADKAALNDVRRKYGLKTEESLKEGWGDGYDRVIPFNGDAKKNQIILDGIQGQMSDGIWENSPGMEKWWSSFRPVDGNVTCKKGDWTSPWAKMEIDDIRKYFANKAKYIAQLWMHDNRINPYKNWNADNTEECDYMHDGITVADLYNFYINNK